MYCYQQNVLDLDLYEHLFFQANEYESSAICSRDSESSETINGNYKFSFYIRDQLIILNLISAITDLKNAFQKLDDRVRVLEGKSPGVSIYY